MLYDLSTTQAKDSILDLDEYHLLDSGDGRKLESFAGWILDRPCAQAMWPKRLPNKKWSEADARFDRTDAYRWTSKRRLPNSWDLRLHDLTFEMRPTDFGHLGIFPEQGQSWKWIRQCIQEAHKQGRKPVRLLNLFAYSGAVSLSAAAAGAEVCHLDASKGMIAWARENAERSGLKAKPVRWIVDDVIRFLEREVRRGRKYDAIIMDPPSFGRGANGEVFKIEET